MSNEEMKEFLSPRNDAPTRIISAVKAGPPNKLGPASWRKSRSRGLRHQNGASDPEFNGSAEGIFNSRTISPVWILELSAEQLKSR